VALAVKAIVRLRSLAAPGQRPQSGEAPPSPGPAPRRPPATSTSPAVDDEDTAAKVRTLMELRAPGQPLAALSDFAKEYGDEAFCLRLLKKCDGDVRRSAEKYKQGLRWREAHRELITTRKFAQGGDNRVIGADSVGRPIAYMCLKNQFLPSTQAMDHMLVCFLQAVDNLPPGVQQATHVWDLHGLSLRMNLNPLPLVYMLQAAESYFAERMHRLIIIDMPRLANVLKDTVWPLVSERTKQKVRFMTSEQAREHFADQCPVESSSRIAKVMADNRDPCMSLAARQATWMRVNASGDLVPAFA